MCLDTRGVRRRKAVYIHLGQFLYIRVLASGALPMDRALVRYEWQPEELALPMRCVMVNGGILFLPRAAYVNWERV